MGFVVGINDILFNAGVRVESSDHVDGGEADRNNEKQRIGEIPEAEEGDDSAEQDGEEVLLKSKNCKAEGIGDDSDKGQTNGDHLQVNVAVHESEQQGCSKDQTEQSIVEQTFMQHLNIGKGGEHDDGGNEREDNTINRGMLEIFSEGIPEIRNQEYRSFQCQIFYDFCHTDGGRSDQTGRDGIPQQQTFRREEHEHQQESRETEQQIKKIYLYQFADLTEIQLRELEERLFLRCIFGNTRTGLGILTS